MPSDQVSRLLAGIDAWNRTGRVPVELFHEDGVWVPPRGDPDFEIHQGPEALARYSESWREVFDEIHWEVVEARESGDMVFLHVTQTGRGRESGMPISMEEGVVYTFTGDKLSRIEEYTDVGEARRAAGLEGLSDG